MNEAEQKDSKQKSLIKLSSMDPNFLDLYKLVISSIYNFVISDILLFIKLEFQISIYHSFEYKCKLHYAYFYRYIKLILSMVKTNELPIFKTT